MSCLVDTVLMDILSWFWIFSLVILPFCVSPVFSVSFCSVLCFILTLCPCVSLQFSSVFSPRYLTCPFPSSLSSPAPDPLVNVCVFSLWLCPNLWAVSEGQGCPISNGSSKLRPPFTASWRTHCHDPSQQYISQDSWRAWKRRKKREEKIHDGSWPGNALGSSWKSWRKCPGRGKSGCSCSGSCPRDLAPDKRMKMDGWTSGGGDVAFKCKYWVYTSFLH